MSLTQLAIEFSQQGRKLPFCCNAYTIVKTHDDYQKLLGKYPLVCTNCDNEYEIKMDIEKSKIEDWEFPKIVQYIECPDCGNIGTSEVKN